MFGPDEELQQPARTAAFVLMSRIKILLFHCQRLACMEPLHQGLDVWIDTSCQRWPRWPSEAGPHDVDVSFYGTVHLAHAQIAQGQQ